MSTPLATGSSPAATYLDTEERRPVTVLFADIVGFTALSERLDAESVREITTECFKRLVPVVTRFEGTVDKFIGDAIMVIFGAPIAHEDDPARAVRSAVSMLDTLNEFNRELSAEHGFTLSLRIGIESGEVVAGLRDIAGVREYTVIGDAVNTAARLQAATEPNTIMVGPGVYQRTRTGFSFRQIPPLELKGKEERVPAWVVDEGGAAGATTLTAEQRTPLIGRQRELAALNRCLDELERGRGQIAVVMGEAGLGKSRLIHELRATRPMVRWRRCQAFSHERDVSYGLSRSAIRDLFDLQDGSADTVSERLKAQLDQIGCSERLPALAYLLGIPIAGSANSQLDHLAAQEIQREIFAAVAAVIERLAGQQPLVIEVDDLQWADHTSIELLLPSLALSERCPVFFCLAFRPERESPAWTVREHCSREFHHRYTELSLEPLDAESSRELAATLLGTSQLPSRLTSVLERAAGTPLWLEELVQTLRERELLVETNGHWHLTADLERISIPTSLQALIVARIDRLGEARTTVQTASVIGREFKQRVLASVTDDVPSLDDHLTQAQRVDLLREMAVIPEREYEFKHVLMQEAAYGTLLTRRRRELHYRVASALEEIYQDRIDELHSVIADHYLNAEAWEQALRFARLAVDAARASYANREARHHLSVAISAADHLDLEPAERGRLFEQRAEVHGILGAFEDARADYESALAIADETGNHTDRARILGALGLLWSGHKNYEQGLVYLEQSIAAARASGDKAETARATVGLGVMLLNQSRMDESRARLAEALSVYRELGDDDGIARTLDVTGMASMMSGDFERAVDYSAEAMSRLNALGDRLTEASSGAVRGMSLGFSGHREEGERWIRYAIGLWRTAEAPTGIAFGNLVLAQINEPYGRYQAAFDGLQESLAIARELDHREWKAGACGWLSKVWRACGDLGAADQLAREMLATTEQLGANIWLAMALGEMGQLALDRGQAETALEYFERAGVLGGEAHVATVDSYLGRARALLLLGRLQDAHAAASRFIDVARGYVVGQPDARLVLGMTLHQMGDDAGAEHHLRDGIQIASDIDAWPSLWRASRFLGDVLAAGGRASEAAALHSQADVVIRRISDGITDVSLQSSFTGLHAESLNRAAAQPPSSGGGA